MDCCQPGPWVFPGKNTGVVCHFLLQGIFPTQGSNLGLPHCRQTLCHLSHREPTSNVVTISGRQERDSTTHTQVSILPQSPLPSRLLQFIEQSPCAIHRTSLVTRFKYSNVPMSIPNELLTVGQFSKILPLYNMCNFKYGLSFSASVSTSTKWIEWLPLTGR